MTVTVHDARFLKPKLETHQTLAQGGRRGEVMGNCINLLVLNHILKILKRPNCYATMGILKWAMGEVGIVYPLILILVLKRRLDFFISMCSNF